MRKLKRGPTQLKRKRERPSPYKKRKSAEYLSLQGAHPVDGPWTNHETCLLFCVTSLIEASHYSDAIGTKYHSVVKLRHGLENLQR